MPVSNSCNGSKGQLISKGLVGILNSSKKRTKKIDLIPQVDLVSFILLEDLKTPKSPLEINNQGNQEVVNCDLKKDLTPVCIV